MSRASLHAFLMTALVAVACSSNTTPNGVMPCGPGGTCAPGYTCNATDGLCVMNGSTDAGTADSSTPATPDANTTPDAGGGGATLDTMITAAPPAATNQTGVSFSFIAVPIPGGQTNARFECSVDMAAFSSCTSPLAVTVTVQGTHTFRVRAIDGANVPDPTPAMATWVLDLSAPDTTITAGPSGTVTDTSATFSFTSSESGSTFTCQLDDGAATSCTSGQTYSNLAGGSHTFSVAATDPAGNVDASPATRTWTIQGPTPPDTFITMSPPAVTGSGNVTITFDALPSAGATFVCSLNGAPFTTCSSPKTYMNLADGSYIFDVAAVNANGTDATPASANWRVDTSGLVTEITGGPMGPACTTVTFTFMAAGAGVTYQCALDAGAFADCTSGTVTYMGLALGSMHTFSVHATGSDNTVGPTAMQMFTVEASAPVVSIASPADGSTTGHDVTISFSPTDNVTAGCKLDGSPLASCVSGTTVLSGLSGGSHQLSVTLHDTCGLNGNAVANFTVDATPPTVSITSPQSGNPAPASGTIIYTVGDATSVKCTLDGMSVGCDTSGLYQYGNLAAGSHTFSLTATDAHGNTSAPVSVTFFIDYDGPVVESLNVQANDDNNCNATLYVNLSDQSTITEVHCVLNGSDEVCGSGTSVSRFYDTRELEYNNDISAYGVDEWGNVGASMSTTLHMQCRG
jgi:hypothetical protein